MTEEKSIFKRKRKCTGIVISKKSAKTIKVRIERWHFYSLYNKRIRFKKTFLVHDQKDEANIGDKIQLMECRPLSKLKRWRLIKIMEKAK